MFMHICLLCDTLIATAVNTNRPKNVHPKKLQFENQTEADESGTVKGQHPYKELKDYKSIIRQPIYLIIFIKLT